MPANDDYIAAIESFKKLHSAPQIFAKAAVLVQDPESVVEDIVELLKADAGLTADIIKLSNSAHYGFEQECMNLTSAVNRVGFREVVKLIGLAVSKNLSNHDLKHFGITAEDFWSNSVTTALLTEWISVKLADAPQDAYVIGLMRSIGLIIVNKIMDDFGIDEEYTASKGRPEWIKNRLGFDDAFAGATVLKQWNFPIEFCHPILHQYETPEEGSSYMQHRVLHFVNAFIERVGNGFTNDDWSTDGLEFEMMTLGLKADMLQDAVAKGRESYEKLTNSLNAPSAS